MKTYIGKLTTGDFSENTMTFEIEGEFILKAGKVAIMPIAQYEEERRELDYYRYIHSISKGGVLDSKDFANVILKKFNGGIK